MKKRGFALGNWHFILARKVHFVVFLLLLSLRKEQRLWPGLASYCESQLVHVTSVTVVGAGLLVIRRLGPHELHQACLSYSPSLKDFEKKN